MDLTSFMYCTLVSRCFVDSQGWWRLWSPLQSAKRKGSLVGKSPLVNPASAYNFYLIYLSMGVFSPQVTFISPLRNTQDHIYKVIEKFVPRQDSMISLSIWHEQWRRVHEAAGIALHGETGGAVVIEYVLLNWIPYLSHSHAQPSGAAACSSRASSAPVSPSQLYR
jgi:hypothetical protein